MASFVSKILAYVRTEWPSFLLVFAGLVSPIGYMIGSRALFVAGTYLETSLWLRPYATAFNFDFACHYPDGAIVPIVMTPKYQRFNLSVRFSSYLLMVADEEAFFPLGPFLQNQLCRTGTSTLDPYVISGSRCPAGASEISIETHIAELGDGSLNTIRRVTKCDR